MKRPSTYDLIEARAMAALFVQDASRVIEARHAHEFIQSELSARYMEIADETGLDDLERLLRKMAHALGFGLIMDPAEEEVREAENADDG